MADYVTASDIVSLSSDSVASKTKTNLDTLKTKASEVYDDLIKSDSELHKLMMANGLFNSSDMTSKIYNGRFYPYPRIDPYNRLKGTKEIVFFTKPSLPIITSGSLGTTNLERNPYFVFLKDAGYEHILKILSGRKANSSSSADVGGPFINILTNRITATLNVPDINVEALTTAQNMWGTKILYPKSSISSDEGSSFTAEFEDTKYLEIYHLFKAWDSFRQGKWMGIYDMDENDVLNKILYDHIAVYKFIIGEDGETLIYWCKWIGVYPESITRSAFSDVAKEGPLKISIGFKCSGWFEDMRPEIIGDFNGLVRRFYGINMDTAKNNSIWNKDYDPANFNYHMNQEDVLCPYIVISDNTDSNGFKHYYFSWVKSK